MRRQAGFLVSSSPNGLDCVVPPIAWAWAAGPVVGHEGPRRGQRVRH